MADKEATTDCEMPELEGFTMVKLLGRGGMASVWEARQHDPDRTVAIKILNPDISENPENIEAFYAEAKRAAELDHENIVTVFEVGCRRGRYYYVMELAAGYDTGTWLRRKGHLGEGDVLTIAESVAVALDYAFKKIGIVHCDIKPGNIMVHDDGTVRLTDLGIARFARAQNPDDDYVSGTPAFMSPEQVRGAELDTRADIYSLGATIYNLLTGRRLFDDKSDQEVMDAQCSEQAPDMRSINPEISYPCAVLVSQMLAKSRALRPSGWPVVIRDIQRVRQGQMPLGKVPTGMQSTMRLDPPPEGENQSTAAEDGKKDAALRDRRRRRDNMIVWIAATFVAATVAFLAAYFVTLRML
jgi:serine/threonine protein kinase